MTKLITYDKLELTVTAEYVDDAKRKSKCTYGCKDTIVESKESLPFFKEQKDKEYDEYYCGCYGWD